MYKKNIIIIFLSLLIVGAGCSTNNKTKTTSTTKNQQTSTTTNKQTSTQKANNNTTSKKKTATTTKQKKKTSSNSNFKITNLQQNDTVSKSFMIKGEAPGTWFFEGDFKIVVHNSQSNKIVTTSIATAEKNWMTKDLVPFTSTINLRKFQGEEIVVEFEKANPSGKPALDKSEFITLRVKKPKTKQDGEVKQGVAEDGCVISGCSNQICADKGVISTCEYKPHYECYRSATCERQDNGNCGWTKDEQLKSCLSKYDKN